MTTEKIRVSSLGSGIEEALAATEKLGAEGGLNEKQALHLRLLAEELFGMLRSIAGNVEAVFQLDREDQKYTFHLTSDVDMTKEMREQLISISSEGKNESTKGFMGKIREMIAVALLPDEKGTSYLSDLSLGLMSLASNSSPSAQQASADVFRWSMQKYKDSLESEAAGSGEANAAWDELEKSIVASIADEVSVCVSGSNVVICIFKAF